MSKRRVEFQGDVHLVGPLAEFTICGVAEDAEHSEAIRRCAGSQPNSGQLHANNACGSFGTAATCRRGDTMSDRPRTQPG